MGTNWPLHCRGGLGVRGLGKRGMGTNWPLHCRGGLGVRGWERGEWVPTGLYTVGVV